MRWDGNRHTEHNGRRDAGLVARVRTGDRNAFSDLYRAHARAVHTAVRDNVHDADSAADVVQETFTRALARLDSLRQPDRFRPWLLSIARHAAVDSRRHRTRIGSLSDEAAEAIVSDREAPEVQAELRDLVQLLDDGVAALSPRDATALSMVAHLGFGPTELGAALGVKTGAAKVIVHRARRRLREAVALHVLVRTRSDGCHDFRGFCRDDDMVGAARHLRSCQICDEAAEEEVAQYDNNFAKAGR